MSSLRGYYQKELSEKLVELLGIPEEGADEVVELICEIAEERAQEQSSDRVRQHESSYHERGW